MRSGYHLCWMTALYLIMLASCAGQTEKHIILVNDSDMERAELVSIDYGYFVSHFGSDTLFRLVDEKSGREWPYQFEWLGSERIQNILVWTVLSAGESISLSVEKGAAAAVPVSTFARYVPERMDDFAWENDKIAFRMYGKALEDFPEENAHGIDVWAKRTARPVINEWYSAGDYHTDHGDGLDYYSVGLTLGAGDIAPYVDGKIHFPGKYRRHAVLDNGPLRSTFRLSYEPWDVAGRTVSMEKTISIDAGSQLSKVEAVFRFEGHDPLPVVAGIVLRGNGGTIINEKTHGFAAYWEPADAENGTLGIAVLHAEPLSEVFQSEGQLLSRFSIQDADTLAYYTGAAWDKAGEIKTDTQWKKYLENFRLGLVHPIKITIE